MATPKAFINFYIMRIKRGSMTIEEVPGKYRADVAGALENEQKA